MISELYLSLEIIVSPEILALAHLKLSVEYSTLIFNVSPSTSLKLNLILTLSLNSPVKGEIKTDGISLLSTFISTESPIPSSNPSLA